jgi:hypothetical protein
MTDTDETSRLIHCNSNRIGFLNSSSGWGSYCPNNGDWVTDTISYAGTSHRAPIFYDTNDTGYYTDPNSTSYLNVTGTNKIRADSNRNFGDSNQGWWTHDPYGYGWGKPYGSFRTLEVSSSGDFANEPALFRMHQWGSGAAEFWKPQGTTLYLRETPGGGGGWFTRFYLEGYGESNGSWRAPIFYDSNDTANYLNPNGGSVLYRINVRASGISLGSGNSSQIEVNNAASGACNISFHREGAYGAHFGLDTDNWFSTYGWSAGDGYTNMRTGSFTSYGNIYATGNVTAYSDVKLKENIVTIDSALNKVKELRGVYYNRKNDESKTRKVGVIAQEIQKVLPEVVLTSVIKDVESMLSVDYGNITALLIEAIKEQQKQIDELKALIKK